jgi:hypothetical protein
MNNETCPHCGAERTAVKSILEFTCGTAICSEIGTRGKACYQRQIAAQAAEIERLTERNKILEETVRIACEEYPEVK